MSEKLDWKFRFGRQWMCEAGGNYHEHDKEEEARRCIEYHESKDRNTEADLMKEREKNLAVQEQLVEKDKELVEAKKNADEDILKMKKELEETKAKAETDILKMKKELEETKAKAETDILKMKIELEQAKRNAQLEVEHVKGRYLQEFAKLLVADEPDMDSALRWVKEDVASNTELHIMICGIEKFRNTRRQLRESSNYRFSQRHEVHVSA